MSYYHILKNYEKYKLTLNVIVNVILRYKTCHQFQWEKCLLQPKQSRSCVILPELLNRAEYNSNYIFI